MTIPGRPSSPALLLTLNLAVAAAYLAGGYAGVKLSFVSNVVTLFWPPSGLAFAAVSLCGLRLLPGIWLGQFLTNLIAAGNASLAAVVAFGSMGAALASTVVLRALLRPYNDTGELRRVLLFILAALGSTTISATIGTLALAASGSLDKSGQLTWLIWWLGDAMGILIVAPPALLWRRVIGGRLSWRRLSEAGALAVTAGAILAVPLVFAEPVWASELGKLCTLLLSLLAGARFGLGGTAWMTLLIALGTIGATLLGAGPFQRGDFYDNFTLLHSHLFTVSLAGMLLAATFADLRRTIGLEKQARAAAEDAAASRVRLLTTISHDVRTPLSGMMTVLQTLDRASIPPELGRLVGLGLRAGRTLTTLVTDILEAARADAGRITLVLAPFSPVASLADVVDLSRPAAAAKGLALHLSCSDRMPDLVSGDRVRFEQIMGNLVVNAVAYTPRGSVGIEASWDDRDGGTLVVEVVDTGPGIEPASIPRMFDAFALDNRPARGSAGLGLGLYICRRLTALMGGALAYAPEPAGGSRFRVALPLSVAAFAPAPPERDADPALRILLVEDDEIAGETTRALLQSLGHDTVLASDSRAALAYAAREAFGLVLLDLRLGEGASGFDVVRSIRALPGPNARVRVVALTGDGMAESHRALKAVGFDGVVVKPLTIEGDLTSTVQAVIWATADSVDVVDAASYVPHCSTLPISRDREVKIGVRHDHDHGA